MDTNTALYPRVSTQEQALEGYSINEQIARMKDYCKAMGWNVYKVYTDAGYSGANTDRPGLQRMIKDVKEGKVKKVLVYKLDRLSRSQKDTLMLIEDIFLANNTDFVSMSENFDTSTPFGRAMIGILAVFAQLEREQIKERMTMGKVARAKEGKFHGTSLPPIGYDYIDGKLIVNEFDAMALKQAFEMFLEGKSIHIIVETLNKAGLTHQYGKWTDSTLRGVLKNKTYIGYISYSKKWYKGIHESIIAEETFNAVQNILIARSEEHQKHNRRPGKATTYLSGYLNCMHCGGKYGKKCMTTHYGTKVYSYNKYACYSRSKKSRWLIKDPNCKNKTWNVSELDNYVFDEIKKLAIDPDYITDIKESRPEDERPAIIKAEINKLDDQINRLMDLYTVGQMPLDIIQDKIHEMNDRKNKLDAELESIVKEKEKRLSREEALKIVSAFTEVLERGDFDEIRLVLSTLIESIDLDNESVYIHWKF